jgi:3-oxoacyl-[acyl-carrier-protein] synthase II
MAMRDAGIEPDGDGTSLGVVLDTGGGGMMEIEEMTQVLLEKGPRRISPFFIPNMMPNGPACQVAILTGAKGPVIASTMACAAGIYAMVEAMHLLRRKEAEVVIAGGTEAPITPLCVAAFARMGALSSRNDEPLRASRPFDKDRDGFVCGEGAAVMILETLDHALQRGAPIYAEVAGGSLTCDAYHITAPDPAGDGAARAMQRALKDARMKPGELDAVFAHGTSTPLNDVGETKAIKASLGDDAYRVAVSATKSMVGHLLGAAGAISSVAAVLAIRDSIVPPTINLETRDPECDLDYVPNAAREQRVRAAMVNGFGFGGQNVALVVKEYLS